MIRFIWTRQQKIVFSQEIGGGIRQPTKPGRTQLVHFIVTWFYSFGKKSLHKCFIYVCKNRRLQWVDLDPKSPQMFRTDYRDCLPSESLSFTALHMSGHSLSVLFLVVISIIIIIIIIIFSLLLLLGHFLSVLLLLLSLVIFSSFPSLRCGRITMHKNLASLKLTFNLVSLGVGCLLFMWCYIIFCRQALSLLLSSTSWLAYYSIVYFDRIDLPFQRFVTSEKAWSI